MKDSIGRLGELASHLAIEGSKYNSKCMEIVCCEVILPFKSPTVFSNLFSRSKQMIAGED
jgi:hypothetical protein